VKYPKLAAAIDEFLAKQVKERGEDLIEFAIATLAEPVPEPPKVEFKQTEVRTDEH
jgi:hypothetical protein